MRHSLAVARGLRLHYYVVRSFRLRAGVVLCFSLAGFGGCGRAGVLGSADCHLVLGHLASNISLVLGFRWNLRC